MALEAAGADPKNGAAPSGFNPIKWVTISTSIIATILIFTTIFMHSWLIDSGTVEINTTQIQAKQVDWDLSYGLLESISHFGEEVEYTDYDCTSSENECKGVKTAGLAAIFLIVSGAITAVSAITVAIKKDEKINTSKKSNQLATLTGILFLAAPIFWLTILPGAFPPIDGMRLGLAFYLAISVGLLATAGGVLGILTSKTGGQAR